MMHDEGWMERLFRQVRIYLECERAEALIRDSDVPGPQPDEFEKVWDRIQESDESESEK